MSNEACVWKHPSWPDSQVATDGISSVLVQEQKITAPISSGRTAGMSQGGVGGVQGDMVEPGSVYRRSSMPVLRGSPPPSSATSSRRRCG